MEAKPLQALPKKMKAYPVRELGGLVFAYMGPEPVPALPPWDLFVWPNAVRQIGINVIDCNWLQCQENTGDPTHSVWAHGHLFNYVLERQGDSARQMGSAVLRLRIERRCQCAIAALPSRIAQAPQQLLRPPRQGQAGV